jgi:CheY-like chemotaxis protein
MTPRIAIFNHSSSVLMLFQTLLSKKGFQVIACRDTNDVSEIAQLKPDAIVVSSILGYGEIDITIIARIRALPALQMIPIILCTTGVISPEEARGFRHAHGVSIVAQPFTFSQLTKTLHEALQSVPVRDMGCISLGTPRQDHTSSQNSRSTALRPY